MKPLYLLLGEEAVGPVTPEEILARLRAGEVNSGTLWTVENGTEWKPLHELPGLLPPAVAGAPGGSTGVGLYLVWLAGGVFIVFMVAAEYLDGALFNVPFWLWLAYLLWPLPAVISSQTNHPQKVAIGALNLVAGWTFVGWVVALVWSLATPKR